MNNSQLRKKAQRRVRFKEHVAAYFLMNVVLWVINIIINAEFNTHIYWAAFITIAWGFGLSIHFAKTYLYDPDEAVEKEYKKLKTKCSEK